MDSFKSRGLDFEHDITEAPGHAIELAKCAAEKGCELVVSVGGDGTINEIVNGLYEAGNIGDAVLGIISTGTGSDYVRTIGKHSGYEAACRCFMEPGKLAVDLGVAEYMNDGQKVSRLFINFAGMGFDAEIVRRTSQQFKTLGSTPAYLMGLFATLLFYRNRDIYLSVDGEVIEGRVCTVLMNNGKYGGGGMFTAPDASVSDGFFDVLIIGDLTKPDLLWSLPRIYKGTHLTHPKVSMRRAKEIEIRSAKPMYLQADGELLGELPCSFRVLPSALNVAV